MMYRSEFSIGGEWAKPTSAGVHQVVSPSSEEVVGEVPEATNADMDRAVAAARQAFDEGPWPRMSPAERADILARAAELLRQRTPDVAAVLVDEMGIAISQAPQQMSLVAPVFDYYADLARGYEFERPVLHAGLGALVTGVPVGVVAAIVPWNAPVTLATWKVAPALAAGCTVVLKPPLESPLSNYILAEALHEAGVPAGVFNLVPGGRDVGEHLVTHPGTDKVAFTGSTAAGKRIMSLCGEQIKRVSLELGGKSAALILDDADVATTVTALVHQGMHNSGQVCGMQSRLLIPRPRYAEALDAAAAAIAAVPVGDPHETTTVVGPLVAERQRDRVEGYLRLATEEGARIVAGGSRPAHLSKGWYVEPTVVGDATNQMRVVREEIFGPVVCLVPYDGDDEGVTIANDSPYGLAGSVFTADDARGLAVARRLRTGSVTVNRNFPPMPLTPFGGFRESGIGRELGVEGLQGYLETRTISVPASLAGGAR
ncbi:aldehyde dehydrogenase [Actinoplanes sp. RD1]|uniref:aldehyde dehydrogenase n=1 Tax=Actinoplanes sp. RD1 TaxID=3064538 RepID=UPI002741F447|nr:aldehyde dehydrogenase [Actinoplanes sp. RD1]